MKKLCWIVIILNIGIFNLAIAAEEPQTGTVNILPGNEIAMYLPQDFAFDPTFIPTTNQITLKKLLNPLTESTTLTVKDLDPSRSFVVTFSISDLVAPDFENRIRFNNIGVVSLSSSTSETVDGESYNTPPFAPNTFAPLDCDIPNIQTWESDCMGQMTFFSEPSNLSTTLPYQIVPSQNYIPMDTSSFLTNGYVITENDLIKYSGKTAIQLTGVSDISESHLSGSTIQQYWTNSQEETLLENNSFTDTGNYSVGFGFVLNVDSEFLAEDYEGIITFTLITN